MVYVAAGGAGTAVDSVRAFGYALSLTEQRDFLTAEAATAPGVDVAEGTRVPAAVWQFSWLWVLKEAFLKVLCRASCVHPSAQVPQM